LRLFVAGQCEPCRVRMLAADANEEL
jgi:hypothetical protein